MPTSAHPLALTLTRLWKSRWWIPISFLTLTAGVAVAFTIRPAIILTAGTAIGIIAHRTRLTTTPWWKTFLRTTLFIVAGTLMFISMWGFTPSTDLGLAATVVASSAAVLTLELFRRRHDTGRAALYAWAGQANPGPWMTSLATGISPTAITATATADVSGLWLVTLQLRLLRKGSALPLPRWSLVDYLVPTAALAGLCTGTLWERPFNPNTILTTLATITGILGTAAATGSLLAENGHHPPDRSAVTEYLTMVLIRSTTAITIGTLCWQAGWLPTAYLPLVAAAAFSAPTINPASLAVLYGYRNATTVAAAVRLGLAIAAINAWILAAIT